MADDEYTLRLTRAELETLQDAVCFHHLEACRAVGAAESAGRAAHVARRWMEETQSLGRKVDALVEDADRMFAG